MNESNTCGNRKINDSITQSLTVSIPKDATVVMIEYLGLLSQQKLVHGMVVSTMGETRRGVCLCKEGLEGGEARREGALRRDTHMSRGGGLFGGKPVVCPVCGKAERDSPC